MTSVNTWGRFELHLIYNQASSCVMLSEVTYLPKGCFNIWWKTCYIVKDQRLRTSPGRVCLMTHVSAYKRPSRATSVQYLCCFWKSLPRTSGAPWNRLVYTGHRWLKSRVVRRICQENHKQTTHLYFKLKVKRSLWAFVTPPGAESIWKYAPWVFFSQSTYRHQMVGICHLGHWWVW